MTMSNDKEIKINDDWENTYTVGGFNYDISVKWADQFRIYIMRDYSVIFSEKTKAHLFRLSDIGITRCGKIIHVDCLILLKGTVLEEYRCKVCTNQGGW